MSIRHDGNCISSQLVFLSSVSAAGALLPVVFVTMSLHTDLTFLSSQEASTLVGLQIYTIPPVMLGIPGQALTASSPHPPKREP